MKSNRRDLIPWLYFLTSISLTLMVWYFISRSFAINQKNEFRNLVQDVEHEIQSRMDTYIDSLTQMQSMYYVTKEVNRSEFNRYVTNLNLLTKYPGIQAISYAQRVKPQTKEKFVKQIRQEGFADFKIWPSNQADEFYPVTMIEPFSWRNRRAFGFDLSTDPVRRKALDLSRDTGLPAITGRVKLMQETTKDSQYGFLIFMPIYSLVSTELTSVEERRKELSGYLAEPFRAEDLFKQIFSHVKHEQRLDIEVYLGQVNESSLIFDSIKNEGQKIEDNLFESFEVQIAQSKWIVKIAEHPKKISDIARYIPVTFLILGIILSCLFFWISRNQRKNADQEEERADQFEKLYQFGRALSGELDLEKFVQAVTDAGLELSKAQFGAFFYTTLDEKGGSMNLSTIAGAKKEDFDKFPMPRNTEVFGPTFKNEGTVCSQDITLDPRYGQNKPYHGLPEGHLPVRSYLAVSVVSRTGEVIGALFYGHADAGVFTEREQKFVEGIASQAAVGIDNARLYQEAKDALRSRDEFLSIASHELKTPVTSMKLQFQMAKRMIEQSDLKVYSPEAVKRRVNLADSQLERMRKLIDDMLDSSKISSSQLNLDKAAVDLGILIDNIIERFQEQFDAQGIEIKFNKNEVPLIQGDYFRLEQVISNLLSNALKYGDKKPVEITLKQEYDKAIILVKDMGVGIPESSFTKIFECYERAVAATNISGLGLGLYISQRIMKAHDGVITVESEPGKGSTFTVSLPVK